MRGFCKNRQGVTLVELLIVLALISIIITGATTLFIFGHNTFKKGSSQYQLQNDVRFALQEMTEDIRYAYEIEVGDNSDYNLADLMTYDVDEGIYSNIGTYDTYIFYDLASESIVKLQRPSIQHISLPTDSSTPLTFTAIGSPANTLHYEIDGIDTDNGRNFEVISEIFMLNTPEGSADSGEIIKYMTEDAYVSKLQWPEATLDGENSDVKLEIAFDVTKPVKLFAYEVYPGDTNVSKQLTIDNVSIIPESTQTTMLTVDFQEDGTNPNNFVDGDQIRITVDFGSEWEYQAFYDLIYVGGGTKAWTLE